MRVLKEILGLALMLLALAVLAGGVVVLRTHDYVSAIVLTMIGLGVLGAAVELVRPSMGE